MTHSATTQMPAISSASQTYRAPLRVKAVRAVLLLALVPLAFYLVPRVVNLVVTPDRLDHSVVYAHRYNPQLMDVVKNEQVTNASLTKLDNVSQSLANVRATVAKVDNGLVVLVNQVRGQLQNVLNASDAEVTNMLHALDALAGRIANLNGPIDGAASAVHSARSQIAAIISEGKFTAGNVGEARRSAERAANDVSGK